MSLNTTVPKVIKILQQKGEINDELDYALMNYLLQHIGPGYTACQPQLVELDDGNQAIKMGIDNTFIGKDNKLMGLGIVGTLFVDVANLKVIFCSSREELEENTKKLQDAGVEPQVRPRGKY
ncbi:MAG: hypothetical protein JW891_10185 [Candidatus Lokiarchaeota archaeon]|nr:hypothetical protein [Candidatus Lokiarchaeota archaeon]